MKIKKLRHNHPTQEQIGQRRGIFYQSHKQPGFITKVKINRPAGDTGHLGDVLQTGSFVALIAEDRQGGGE